ncbi:flagellar biosynthetic protein FliR [Parasporobacterium paucivorans]|uniref:Flagellar biosynthetic protein FliR n=1 Tax=Parasporobacterium paucivorans DSM 15970 TaxID=1122934 RepID=A0A1M6I9Q1_9FIRM|nr:flagellar biosynthetic protein FliR [Parasporobacterium paucivorans]SHJ31116.1 flagellar biosynthetic protein FliR [Parasporobacterium paucivorans DSM 15970]
MGILTTAQFMLFSLVFMRMSGFILLNPVLGRRNIPMVAKGGMIMVLSFLIYSFMEGAAMEVNLPIEYAVLLLKEFAIGYVLGFVMQLFEFVVTFAGSLIDYQMGLAMSSIYDPQSGGQVALSGQLFQIFTMLLFFAVDGHLALMKILVTSAQVVPFGEVVFTPALAGGILDIFCQCVVLAVKLAFPFIAMEFLTEIGVGILMKMIPQINVFVVNIQVKILVGLIMLTFLFSPVTNYLENLNINMINTLQGVLKMF